jgi:hypothetical protein
MRQVVLSRRDFLKASLVGAIALGMGRSAAATDTHGLPIIAASLGEPIPYINCEGDVWSTTWADDDNLYSVSDDTRGFNNACNSNLAVNRIRGEMPPELEGTTINPMSEYGYATETSPIDNGTWKGAGLTCIDGVLYLGVCRNIGPYQHAYVRDPRGPEFWLQYTWDASIIKSVDHGKTWSAQPKLGHAMFPGRNFCYPGFVEYGKNGQGSKDEFVYAVSPDGSWNNASNMTMGRVPRRRIERLDPRDWEFFHGFDANLEPRWFSRQDTAWPIFTMPARTSFAEIFYIPGLDIYILPQWSRDYDLPESRELKFRKKTTRFEFYQSRAPWGPWTLFHRQITDPQGFYCPVIPTKFISKDGCKFWLFTAGNPPMKGWYKLNMTSVSLEVLA